MKVEIFLLKNLGRGLWETLVKPGSKLPENIEVIIGDDISVRILTKTADGGRIVKFSASEAAEDAIKRFGQVPLPPYIKTPLNNPARYQTVYAEKDGSVAAPTAALHFTKELLARIVNKGVVIVYITLHMGLGSFRPIKAEKLASHRMPEEYYEIPATAAGRINQAMSKGNKIIACGTDVVRALESAAKNGKVVQGKASTRLFITPGSKFKIVDTLITNLHLPRSSHLVLVSAFAGRKFVFEAYQYAIKKKFGFYTFGDATIVI